MPLLVPNMQKILLIKLGALGDFIQAAGPFGAIRQHHPDAEITLLTSPIFANFSSGSPWFDKVKIDLRPKIFQLNKLLKLRNWLKSSKFYRIYDLQTSDRSGFYYKLFWPNLKPDWSGIAPGCSHPHANPRRDLMHTIERQQEQLSMAGISSFYQGDFSWINKDISSFGLTNEFALLVPGGAAHRPAKRWPTQYYQKVIQHLVAKNVQPVLIGGEEEEILLKGLARTDPTCISLAGKTTIDDLFSLAQKARFALGNDTGPMHAAATSGCKTIVLYSSESNPVLCAQRGDDVTILRENSLSNITPDQIIEVLGLTRTQNQT